MARLFDDFEEFRRRVLPPPSGVVPGAGTEPQKSTIQPNSIQPIPAQTGDQWFTNLIKSITTRTTPSAGRWTEPVKTPIAMATNPSAPTIQQSGTTRTAPVVEALPTLKSQNNSGAIPGIPYSANGGTPSYSVAPREDVAPVNTGSQIQPYSPAISGIAPLPSAPQAPEYNPNDLTLQSLMGELQKVSTTGGPSVARNTAIKAITKQIDTIAPMTSTGAYGIAGMREDTSKRGQDITAATALESLGVTARGQDVTARGQDLNAQAANVTAALKADENSMNAMYRSGLLKQGQEEVDIKKTLADSKNPQNYMKLVQILSPKIKTIDPETGAEMETLDEKVGIAKARQFGFEPPETIKKGLEPAAAPAGYTPTGKTMNGKAEYYNAKTKRYWTP
jgi:hypothetical protein